MTDTITDNEHKNGWHEWSKHVLAELSRLNKNQESMHDDVTRIREDIAALKVKSGVWGMLGGSIPLAIAIALKVLK